MTSRPAPSRPQPVSDVVVERLFDDVEGLAKRWILALIAARPLRELGDIPVERIAAEAPALCAQVLRALSSDEALERLTALEGSPDAHQPSELADRIGELSGASDGASTVYAVEALRGSLWQGFAESLPGLTPGQAGALSDRLAHVCAALCARSLRDRTAARSAGTAGAPPAAPGEPTPPDPAALAAPPQPQPDYPRIERREQPEPPEAGVADLGWEMVEEPSEPTASDERESTPWPGGSASWLDSVTAELEPDEERGQRLAILVIEVVDIEHIRRAEDVDQLGALMGRVEAAIARGLRPADRLAQEGAGRWWLVAPRTSSKGARLLAERVAGNVRAAVSHRGVPLDIVAGVASTPDDGEVPSQLAEQAERELYAARASGLSVAPGR